MQQRPPLQAALIFGLALSAAFVAVRVSGQAGEEESPARSRVYPPTDRVLSRGMRRAEESIARGEFSQAIAFLDEVLGRSEDFFTETDDSGGFAGLKETARRLIRDLPPEGRRTYESTFGPVAQRELRAAVAEGNSAGVEAVVERYFDTPAGYQAAMLLAAQHSDEGRHLAAALLYQQLLDAPAAVRLYDPELSVRAATSWIAADDAAQAERVLKALSERGLRSVEIAGRDYSLDGLSNPLEWIRSSVGEIAAGGPAPEPQWLTYRGNAARNGETAGGLPHMHVRWRVRLMNHWKLEQLFQDYAAELAQAGAVVPVASAPLAAGNYVLVRTPHGLLAVDFRTGKRVWRSELQRDPQLEQLMKAGAGGEMDGANAEAARAFARRIWEDYLYGMASSDGARVYVIRDLPMPMQQDYELTPFMGAGNADMPSASNRLSAYDLEREGALTWEIDGAAPGGPLPGAFFLGAPMALGSSLYVLAEINDAISLVVIDRATGAIEWKQHLANLETGVRTDLRRRVQSVMPSYDGGMLVCPTGAGLVVGVDLSKRSLAWAYQYDTVPPAEAVYRGGPEDAGSARSGQWTDGTATIAAGRVLLSPRESKQLHCLDLHTGRMIWRRDQTAMKEIACVYEGRVVLADSTGLTAVQLADGEKAWNGSGTTVPRGVSPSGTGFVSAGRYFLPLTSGEVVAVDLTDGRIVDRVKSRDGSPLGNLICHRGAVISQNGMFLDCFDQIDVLRDRSEAALAANPSDVESLRALGEIAYNQGRLSEAIELIERAYRLTPDDLETSEILAECLAAALDEDFAAYRARLPLLKELQQGGSLSTLAMLRIEAQGLLASGDSLGSAEACLALYRAAPPDDETFTLRGGHEMLASRWIGAQLAEIWDATTADQRPALAELLEAEVPALDDSPDAAHLERFLTAFGALPIAMPAKLARARQLETDGRLLESQQLLLDLASAETELANPVIAREATALIAAQFRLRGLALLSREFDARLTGKYADQVCLDGATGRQLLERWNSAQDSPTPRLKINWPTGRVVVDAEAPKAGGPSASRARAPMWNIRLEHADSVLTSGVGFLAVRGSEVSWQDGYGRPFFQASLEPQSQAIYRQSGSVYGSSRGNLLITSMGRELAAFNTFAGLSSQTPPLLWRASLGSNFDFQDVYLEDIVRAPVERPGTFRTPRMSSDEKWVGVIGPITSTGVVFQDQRRLTCANPVTGVVQWSRSDAPQGCDLFGDDRYVLATPMGSERARVYSAIDGRALREVDVPPWEEQVTTRGCQVIRWHRDGDDGSFELACVDPLSAETAWRHEFAVGSRLDIDADQYIAVVEPSGRTVVIDAATGKELVSAALPEQPRLERIHLLAGAESFTIVAEHPANSAAGREVRAFNVGDAPVVDADIAAFSRPEGRLMWARPASVNRQALLLNMPSDLPFIAFAGTLASRGGDGRESMVVLLLDKATGRTLYSDDTLPQTGMGYCMAQVTDADRHVVTIDVAGRVLTVRFTDERRPPEPPALAEVESPGGKSSGGLMGIFRTIGGAE